MPGLVRSGQLLRLRLPHRPRREAPLRVGPRNDVRAGEVIVQNKANVRRDELGLTTVR
jgi:hypothetical protein